MKIVIIGAGNVATHLAKAFKSADINVAQIWSYHHNNALQLAELINSTAIVSLDEIDQTANCCILAIKDDEIAVVCKQLINFNGLLMHTAGAVDLTVFEGLVNNYGVFYPLQTFSKNKEVDVKAIPFCIEANTTANLNVIHNLAAAISDHVYNVDSEQRKILHLAAVFACNFTNHLYALAADLLATNGLDFDIIRPLIAETASKVQSALPETVQTGPAIRNDEKTMRKHQDLLNANPDLLAIYNLLSSSIKKAK